MIQEVTTIQSIMLTILAVIVLAIFVGCLYSLLSAVFFFVFSGGQEEKKQSAFNSIRYMIFGLLLTLFILFVLPLIFQNMNVPGSDYFVAANIFDRMREVLSYVLEIGGLFQGEITSDGTYYNGYNSSL